MDTQGERLNNILHPSFAMGTDKETTGCVYKGGYIISISSFSFVALFTLRTRSSAKSSTILLKFIIMTKLSTS